VAGAPIHAMHKSHPHGSMHGSRDRRH
jgi:hypothetical protein